MGERRCCWFLSSESESDQTSRTSVLVSVNLMLNSCSSSKLWCPVMLRNGYWQRSEMLASDCDTWSWCEMDSVAVSNTAYMLFLMWITIMLMSRYSWSYEGLNTKFQCTLCPLRACNSEDVHSVKVKFVKPFQGGDKLTHRSTRDHAITCSGRIKMGSWVLQRFFFKSRHF